MILSSIIVGSGSNNLLVLHGFLGMASNWSSYAKKISLSGFKVHLINLRNHGNSFHSSEFSYDLMAKDLSDYVNKHSIKNFSLLGHSMGGKIAIKFSLLYPNKVEHLIVVDILPIYYNSNLRFITKALKSLDLSKIKNRSQADYLLSHEIDNQSMRSFLLKNLSKNEQNKFYFKCNLDTLQKKVFEVEKMIPFDQPFNGKVLIIKGENSDYINEKNLDQTKKMFPNLKFKIIKNAAHWVHAENPELFLEKTHSFLKN